MTPARIISLVAGLIALGILLSALGSIIEVVDASSIVVKQSVDGHLEVWTDQGPHMQNLGNLETYSKSAQFDFGSGIRLDENTSTKGHQAAPMDEETTSKLASCLPIRFNDNGTAKLCGSVSFDLPLDPEQLLRIHKQFRSQEAIVKRIILPALTKSAYNSGAHMSSRESASDRRAELLELLREQATVGIYKVDAKEEQIEDVFAEQIEQVEMIDAPVVDSAGVPVLNADGTPKTEKKPKVVKKHPLKMVKVVRPKIGTDGKIEIAEPSVTKDFGIRVWNFSIDRILYDERVQRQIDAQQEATMAIQTARVNSQKAEQDALTAKAKGEATIAEVKAQKETEKQAAVTEAEKVREVARLDLEAAQFQKDAQIRRAEGEAEARKLVMVADGALDKKLAAIKDIHKFWSDAASKQPLVPSIMMGGGERSAAGNVGVTQFMDVLTAKAVKDLQVDMSVKGQ